MSVDVRAFIFDLDGVVTDTAEFHYLAWKRLATEEGLPFTRKDNARLRGVSRRESLNRLLKERSVDEETAQAWMRRKNDYYVALLEQITSEDILPGVTNLINESHAIGIKVGLSSGSRNARFVLDKLNMVNKFDAIGDGYSVVNAKPAPDLFVWTAGRLDVSPSQAVVFEDAEAGIAAALAGGFWTVGIGQSNVDRAHIVLPGLSDAHAADIISALGTKARTENKNQR